MKKNPFEFNDLNNYLCHKQGRKHFWGMKGKDYGFLESTIRNRTIDEEEDVQTLKKRHLQIRQNQYEEKQALRGSGGSQRQNEKNYEEERYAQENRKLINQYNTQQPVSQHYKMRTEPIQTIDQRARYSTQDRNEIKKRHLSLLSKNIELTNQTPKVDNSKRYSTLDPHAHQREEKSKYFHKRVNTEGNINDDLNKYRERIVKVVRRDRKNNPTFCNSLAYPLHCYRYVQ